MPSSERKYKAFSIKALSKGKYKAVVHTFQLFPCLMGQVLVFILAPQLQIHPESLKQLQ
jgi:cellobiose-specific phosphotransferase system component IIB